jgi:outer membrane protein assembly factor BamB
LKNLKNEIIAISIAALMIVSMSLAVLPSNTVTAHTPKYNLTTNAYISVNPNPIGVGQSTLIYMWLNRVYDGAAIGNNNRFHNYTLVITSPNGTVTTKYWDAIQDTTSNQGFYFTPDNVGTYNMTFIYPGQNINDYTHDATSQYVNDTYLPSNATTSLVVQQDAIPYAQQAPLPTEYWTRPIYGENTNWYTISSNWLGSGSPGYGGFSNSYNSGGNGELVNTQDAVGPLTSHVMWTKSLQSGGVVGGNNSVIQGDTYFEGSAYNQRYTNPIIVNGRIYYTEQVSFTNSFGTANGPTSCVDLTTGKLIWSRSDVPVISFAYIYDVQDPNQHGVYNAILFTSNFARAFDADTGNPLFNVTNVPSATQYTMATGPNGEQLRFVLTNKGTSSSPNWYLAEWNSSKLWSFTGLAPSISGTTDASTSDRYDWNVSVSALNSAGSTITVVRALYNDTLLCYSGTLPSQGATFTGTLGFNDYTYYAISLAKGQEGTLRWSNTLQAPSGNLTVMEAGVDPVNRVFTETLRETNNFVGYNLDTGAKIWGPTTSQTALDYYGSPSSGTITDTIAYGKLYAMGYGGIVYCYDTKTGDLLWTYGNGGTGNSTNSGFEVPGNYPTFVQAIGNGVVYLATSEHTVETPIYKGSLARAINATTGEEIWTLSSYTGEFFGMSYAIADGYATWFNGYDNQIYSVGKGPTTLNVDAPTVASTLGSNVVIRGSVYDVSAGTQQNEQAGRFAKGVPCASDSSMKDWMGYVYQQQALPSNFTGVEVTIDVRDSNGNYRNIGTATTDESGAYTLTWKPDITGDYTVIATFHGTNGYWSSYSETSFTVDPAAATPQPTAAPTQSVADMYFVPAVAGIIIAIIIVGFVLALLLLRKRP